MSKRIYFLTSEIVPFAEEYFLAPFSKEVPNVFIKQDTDFRVMMPKYGFISERRYILREVIRLRDMKLKFQGEEVDASVKSAFVPNTKVQVYFLENEDYYKPTSRDALYSEDDENARKNSERFGYFSSAALTTLNYLRWEPDVIICNDWQMSLLPLFLESDILDNDYFEDVDLIQIVHSKSDKCQYSIEEYESIGLGDVAKEYAEDGKLDSMVSSMQISDEIVFIDREDTDLVNNYKDDETFADVLSKNEDKLNELSIENTNEEDWEKLANEIEEIIEQI